MLGNEASNVLFIIFRLLYGLEIKKLAQLALRYEGFLISFVCLNFREHPQVIRNHFLLNYGILLIAGATTNGGLIILALLFLLLLLRLVSFIAL